MRLNCQRRVASKFMQRPRRLADYFIDEKKARRGAQDGTKQTGVGEVIWRDRNQRRARSTLRDVIAGP